MVKCDQEKTIEECISDLKQFVYRYRHTHIVLDSINILLLCTFYSYTF